MIRKRFKLMLMSFKSQKRHYMVFVMQLTTECDKPIVPRKRFSKCSNFIGSHSVHKNKICLIEKLSGSYVADTLSAGNKTFKILKVRPAKTWV